MTNDSQQIINNSIRKIKAGDLQERDRLLNEYKPFVWKVANTLCKRYLDWSTDDELSIALIGFNDAIDTFEVNKNVPFLAYARVVIQNRLKDFFRKKAKTHLEVPLEIETEQGETFHPGDVKAALDQYQSKTIEEERQSEIEVFEQMLQKYGIEFEDLVIASPKHRDSRQTLFNVAQTLVSNSDLIEYLLNKKQLPLNSLFSITQVNRKTLERGRKFIISTALILYYKEEFLYLRSYINLF